MNSGRFQRGNNRSTKITNEQVFEILDKYRNHGYTQGKLAREYGVNRETIGRYIRGESRNQIPMPPPVAKDPMEVFQRLMALQEQLNQATGEPPPDADELLKQLGDSK